MTEHRTPAGVPTGGQFAASARAESGASLAEAAPPRVTFDWAPDDTGSWVGSSGSGWGSRATIVPPEHGNGEDFYWEVHQNGWTWDGRTPDLEAAQGAARDEANRMLTMQEAEGINWDESSARHFPNLDPGLFKTELAQESIRAHALRENDLVHVGGQVGRVTSLRMDAPGRSGRKIHLTTETGEHSYPINDAITVSRDPSAPATEHAPGPPRTSRA